MSYSLKIETGRYLSGATAASERTPIGDGPDFALTKRLDGVATVAYTKWRRMGLGLANSPGGAFSSKTGQITDLTRDGLYVGSGQHQNGANYGYLTIKSNNNKFFQTGRYVGNGADNRNLVDWEGTFFQPDIVWIHRITDGNQGCMRTSAYVGDLAQPVVGVAAINMIQAFLPNGFQLGTNGIVNSAGEIYDWWALKAIPGAVAVGSFVGNATARSIDVGFAPTAVLVKNTATSDSFRLLTSAMVAGGFPCIGLSAVAADANEISGLTATGFTLGTAATINGAGQTITYVALRDGEYYLGD